MSWPTQTAKPTRPSSCRSGIKFWRKRPPCSPARNPQPKPPAILQDNLDALAQTAAQEIAARGYHYPVKVCLEETWFPTRQYENVSLPAGNYQALRVLIGEGAGKNWWCVVFPSLCLSAVTEESLQTAGLSHQEYALISEESQPYTIRFKAVEWWEACKHWFSRNES